MTTTIDTKAAKRETSAIDEIKVLRFQIEMFIRLTQGNINSLRKTDNQIASYLQEDLDTFQKDTGITDEQLYGQSRIMEATKGLNLEEE